MIWMYLFENKLGVLKFPDKYRTSEVKNAC